jgi:hypothetical protein
MAPDCRHGPDLYTPATTSADASTGSWYSHAQPTGGTLDLPAPDPAATTADRPSTQRSKGEGHSMAIRRLYEKALPGRPQVDEQGP